ncbi:MAG: thiamine pyrophosphate-dependent dehydrogenase E1 component subunit alpha [Spirochaetia bacterium]|nr:thiamine pyrophosphate-dependent dehydrogenase E1 component subunit alpha [Spirochaetia bacterium]
MSFVSDLKGYVNPNYFTKPVNLFDFSKEFLIKLLKKMVLIRFIEEEIGNLILSSDIKCPCHLAIGQEAIAAGISENLTCKDKVFGNHRSHAHYLAMGGDIYQLIAEVFGKIDGCSLGMGGSMHIIDREKGFQGSVPIVGGTIPIAVGAALAAKFDKKNHIAVTFFGDGACEEGILHESLNFASAYDLPVLFVCENNLYSSHLDIKIRQPSDMVSRFAHAHKISSNVIDGNNIIEVVSQSKKMIEFIRKEQKPAFLEAVTYRWRGHVGPDENIDVGVRRSQKDLAAWKNRDPIKRLKEAMVENKSLTEISYKTIESDIRKEIHEYIASAKKSEFPPDENLKNLVYSA